jgi:RNA polymerase sigma-70 factor (ECF subfamily)
MAVALRYLADLPEAEIATVMGVSRGTVASTLSSARRHLARLLVPEEEGCTQ